MCTILPKPVVAQWKEASISNSQKEISQKVEMADRFTKKFYNVLRMKPIILLFQLLLLLEKNIVF